MYVRGVKSVIRCYKRTYAIFVAQIGGVLELERHECGAMWSADVFSDENRDATGIDWLDGLKSAVFVPF